MTNVALVGDHTLNLHALAYTLRQSDDIRVTTISKSQQWIRQLAASPPTPFPDVVILDIHFQLRPAIQVIDAVKRPHPRTRVIVLSLTRDEQATDRLLHAGAECCLPKNADPQELDAALRTPTHAIPAANGHPSAGTRTNHPFSFTAWPPFTELEYRYFLLAASDASNEDIRNRLNLCESSYTRMTGQVYRRFDVRTRDGLVVALFQHRLLVRDDV
jgi:DNA-binding NarL/FixJ family response regulator